MSTRLLDEMRNLMRRRHYSIHTERAYRDWVKRYVRFHNMQSRDDLRDRRREDRGIPHSTWPEIAKWPRPPRTRP